MSKQDIWFPFYIGDYLADTMHLTDAEHGRYLLLLLAYYKNRGPLPDDDDQLASTCKVTLSVWSACRSKLSKFFKIHDGAWHHTRADFEIQRAKSMQEARIKGAKSTNAKLGRGTLSDTLSVSVSDTLSDVQSQSQSHKEGGGKSPLSSGNGNGKITGQEAISLETEIKRLDKAINSIRHKNRDEDFSKWPKPDQEKIERLKTKRGTSLKARGWEA